jgi:hypothetical protein
MRKLNEVFPDNPESEDNALHSHLFNQGFCGDQRIAAICDT